MLLRVWTLRDTFDELEVELHPSPVDDEARARTLSELPSLLARLDGGDPQATRIALEVWSALGARQGFSPQDTLLSTRDATARADAVREALTRAAWSGRLSIRRQIVRREVGTFEEPNEGDTPLGPDSAPGSDPKPALTWIAIQLVDDLGAPVPSVQYQIVLADGSTRSGATDATGQSRIDGIVPGTCQVSFPKLAGQDWA